MKDELRRYICIPFAIKLYKEDREHFKEFKTARVYLAKIDPIIKQLRKDFYDLKRKYHSVRKIEEGKYRYKDRLYEYDPGELRKETTEIMKEYLFTVEAEIDEEKMWDDVDTDY